MQIFVKTLGGSEIQQEMADLEHAEQSIHEVQIKNGCGRRSC